MGRGAQARAGKQRLDGGSVASPLPGLLAEGPGDPKLRQELDEAQDQRDDCQDEDNKVGEGVACLDIARIYLKMKAVDKALTAAKDAKSLFREGEEKVGEAHALEFIAEVWDSVSAYDKAAAAADRARQQFKRVGDRTGELRAMFLACQNRVLPLSSDSSADEVSKAKKTAQEFLDLSRTVGDARGIGSALCAVSQVSAHQDRTQDALDAIDEALPHFDRAGDTQNKASALLMAARIRFGTKDFKKSLEAVQQSLGLFRQCDAEQGETACIDLLNRLREFEFRVGGGAPQPMKPLVGQKVRCGALEWAANGTARA